MKPIFKELTEEQILINFKIPKSWLPKLKQLSKVYGQPYSHFLRDLLGNCLRDYKFIK